MKLIKNTWRKGIIGKVMVGCGGIVAFACLCGGIGALLPGRATPTPAARSIAITDQPATEEPTWAPTDIDRPTRTPRVTRTPRPTATTEPAPTDTSAPTNAAATAIPATSAPANAATATPAPTVAPAPTAAPAEPPIPTVAPAPTVPPTEPPAPTVVADACPQGCTQIQPGCEIIGNVNSKGERIYHKPGWRDYKKIIFRPAEGDRYFCSDQTAEANGFRPAQQ